jgi:hypothetical protein
MATIYHQWPWNTYTYDAYTITASSTTTDNWVWIPPTTYATSANTNTTWTFNTITRPRYRAQDFRVEVRNIERQWAQARREELSKPERVAATKAATDLLLAHLDERERARWVRDNQVHVRSQSGRRYCLEGSRKQHNIFELDDKGVRIKELCVLAEGDIPVEDNLLAQILALRFDEKHLLSRANKWDLRQVGQGLVRV